MHVFVMRENWHAGMATIQSLGRRGHRLTVGVEISPSIHAQSDYVSRVISTPNDPDLNRRAQVLCDLVEREAFDLVVPMSDEDAETVALAAELRPDCNAFVTSDLARIRLSRDRNATWDLCRDLGVGVPQSLRVTRETVDEAARTIGFPCYLKFSQTVANLGVLLLEGLADLEEHLEAIERAGEVQLQEVVDGEFIGVTGFALEGELQDSFAFQVANHLTNAGTPAFAWRHEAPDVTEILEVLTRRMGWTGGIDLDCLRRADGSLVLLEINPRLSGTSHFALVCGIDLPAGYLRAVGAPADTQVFPPQDPELFISLMEEARLRRRRGGLARSRQLRRNHLFATNAYPGDRGYGRALRRRLLKYRLEAWGLGLLRGAAKLVGR